MLRVDSRPCHTLLSSATTNKIIYHIDLTYLEKNKPRRFAWVEVTNVDTGYNTRKYN